MRSIKPAVLFLGALLFGAICGATAMRYWRLRDVVTCEVDGRQERFLRDYPDRGMPIGSYVYLARCLESTNASAALRSLDLHIDMAIALAGSRLAELKPNSSEYLQIMRQLRAAYDYRQDYPREYDPDHEDLRKYNVIDTQKLQLRADAILSESIDSSRNQQ